MSKGFWRGEVIQRALDRDVDSAFAEQKAILEREPNNAQAHFALGSLLQFRGDIEKAIEFFLKAIALDPHYAAPHISVGRIFALRGQYDLARSHAREAERLGNRELIEQLERYPNLKK
jgi:tetratricopeptide (TPR) repeat protein